MKCEDCKHYGVLEPPRYSTILHSYRHGTGVMGCKLYSMDCINSDKRPQFDPKEQES